MLKETCKPNLQFDQQKQPPTVFYKKGVLKNFANFTGKDLCWSLFLIKFTKILLKVSKNFIKSLKARRPEALRPATLLK